MMKKKTLLLLTVLAFVLLLFSGCGDTGITENDGADLPQVQKVELWSSGLDTVDLYGVPVTQDDFKDNTLTVINFWATWCGPCVRELPELQAVNETFKNQNVEIVGVLHDGVSETFELNETVIADAKALMNNAGANYKAILPDPALAETFYAQLPGFPTTFFIDADGNVVRVEMGAHTAKDWEAIINEVLAQLS